MKAVSPPSVGNSTAEGADRKPSSICMTISCVSAEMPGGIAVTHHLAVNSATGFTAVIRASA